MLSPRDDLRSDETRITRIAKRPDPVPSAIRETARSALSEVIAAMKANTPKRLPAVRSVFRLLWTILVKTSRPTIWPNEENVLPNEISGSEPPRFSIWNGNRKRRTPPSNPNMKRALKVLRMAGSLFRSQPF
jgi:hypothetical protein